VTINADLNLGLFGVIVAVSHKDFPEPVQLYSALQAIGVKVEFNDHTGLWIDKETGLGHRWGKACAKSLAF
jgi:hypothetical protein